MDRVIVNKWHRAADSAVEIAQILRHETHPEGFDFNRVRFVDNGSYVAPSDFGLLASVLFGEARLTSNQADELRMARGTHVYLPPHSRPSFAAQAGTQLVFVLAPAASRARGESLLLRDDQFLSACARPEGPMRWILTPQYLSRRVFLHHDRTLISRLSEPVSWFHTTMFDVEGLPENAEGLPVFKMSYNFRTEPNVCFDVAGSATVRMAEHPYQDREQLWGPWQSIDDQTTYHLNEDPGQSEWRPGSGGARPLRNKHEVRIVGGHVSLMCMHDPAPTGAERHATGEYSEYGDLANTLGTPAYKAYLQQMRSFDRMVDVLSMAKASGNSQLAELPEWADYQTGLTAQRAMEAELEQRLLVEGRGREQILRSWMLPSSV